MSDDLVQRLYMEAGSYPNGHALLEDAAAEIERLRFENEVLRGTIDAAAKAGFVPPAHPADPRGSR